VAAKDLYHNHVKNALIKDGWTVTHDPLSLPWGGTNLQVDLAAERLIAAEKGTRKIAVEIKSFISPSPIADLENALGQFRLYRHILRSIQPERELYLAVRKDIFQSLFDRPHGEELRAAEEIRLIVFDQTVEEVLKWIS